MFSVIAPTSTPPPQRPSPHCDMSFSQTPGAETDLPLRQALRPTLDAALALCKAAGQPDTVSIRMQVGAGEESELSILLTASDNALLVQEGFPHIVAQGSGQSTTKALAGLGEALERPRPFTGL